MLISYNNLNNSDSFSSFPISNPNNNFSSSAIAGVQNDHQFGTTNTSTINQNSNLESSVNNFAVPQHTATMSEADRKRAHHNALERKRRDHIKDSFHTLRDAIPNIKGEKVSTSRAQILKAATDYIKTMKNRNTVYQNDIDLIKKQNMEIETQIRQLEKSKLQNGNQCLNSNIIIKAEQTHSVSSTPNLLQLNDNSDDNNDFKFDLGESLNCNNQANNLIHNNSSNVIKANNVLIINSGASTTTSKKFKTIVNPNKNNLMNNSNFM